MTTQLQSIQVDEAKNGIADSTRNIFYKVGGGAALTAGILLLVAMLGLISSVLQPGAINGWLSLLMNNWLIVIFKLHAGFFGVQIDQLHILNLLDFSILVLAGTIVLGLYAALRRTSRFWSIIALVQPFLGMILFIATKNAGRSGVMGAALVISGVMLRSNIFNRVTAYIGILASVLLLAGDFSAGIIPPSAIIGTLVGIGYLLLITWMFLVAVKLFHLGQNTKG